LRLGNGSKVLESQHRNHEVTSQRPDDANEAHDQTSDQAHALFESAQNDANGGGDERPLKDGAFARPGQLEAVAESPRPAHQAAIDDTDEAHVKEYHDERVQHVKS